jgi:hypothetical protein
MGRVSRFLKTMRQYINNPHWIGVVFNRLRSAPPFLPQFASAAWTRNRTEARRSRERSNRLWRNAAGGALRAPSIRQIVRASTLPDQAKPRKIRRQSDVDHPNPRNEPLTIAKRGIEKASMAGMRIPFEYRALVVVNHL